MKDIKQFIIEKFKITSKNIKDNSYNKEVIYSIAEHFGFDQDDEIVKYIENWVIDNNIKKVLYYGDIETIREAENIGMPEEIINDFITDDKAIMNCQEELDKCKTIYSEDFLTILANENLLVFLGEYGGLYASKKKMI